MKIIVIDSGLGGKDFMKKLRGYKCEFVKPHDTIVTGDDKIFVRDKIMKLLLSYSHTKIHSVIIACHSISSCILDILIENNFTINNIPIYEPIVPMCSYIIQKTQKTYKNKNILVLSTPLTQRIRWHYRLLKSKFHTIKYLSFPKLATELELGRSYNNSLDRLQKQKEFIKYCDYVVLGCTHYNTIKDAISRELRIKYNFKGVVLDSNEILANFFVLNEH
jgi:glutamate racemase